MTQDDPTGRDELVGDTDDTLYAGGPEYVPRRASQIARLERGAEVRRYIILERLGAGGMGVVYSAYDPELDRQVAIKLLHTELGATPGEGQARLMREAQAIARISHPNVVAVHDVGTFDGAVVVTMEFVRGASLSDWLTEEDRSPEAIVAAFAQAGRGLAAAHDAGVAHRDFKPDNVLVGIDGRVRVLDFGLAGALESEPRPSQPASTDGSTSSFDIILTAPGAIMGTPAYMAPEQHQRDSTDARTDQFSFCVALWEALTGRRPFAGESLAELATNVVQGRVDDELEHRIPNYLRPALRRGLSVDPTARHPSMHPLVALLEHDPNVGRRGRRVVAGIAVSVAATAAFIATRGGSKADAHPCRGGDALVAEVWDAERGDAIARRFDATELPYAADAWATGRQSVAAYATAWSTAYTDACEATRIRGEQSEELLDRRMICLDTRRQALAASVDVFLGADKAVVVNTQRIVAHLPEIAACADGDALASGVAPPPSERRAEVEAVRARLARARADESAGLVQAAAAPAEQLVTDARATEYTPVIAEALSLRGDTLVGVDDEQGLAVTEEAFAAAISARHDKFAARVAVGQSYTYAYSRQDVDRAQHWLELAAATERRIGRDPDSIPAMLNVRGVLALRRGRFDQAENRFLESIAQMREQADDRAARDANLASGLGNLGAFYAERGDLPKATKFMKEAMDLDIAAHGPKHPSVLRWRNNVGTVHLMQGELDKAREMLEAALEIQVEVLGNAHQDLGATLNNLAIIYRRQGDLDRAEAMHRRVLAIREEAFGPSNPAVAETLGNLAAVMTSRGDHEEALALNQRMLEIRFAEHGGQSVQAGDALGDVARNFGSLRRWEEALDHGERSLAVLAETDARPLEIVNTELVVSEALRKLDRAGEAIRHAEHALELVDETNTDDEDRGAVRFELARALVEAGRQKKRAVALAREALELETGSQNTEDSQAEKIGAWLDEHTG